MDDFTPSLPCLCASFRRAARAVTQLYEQELRLVGLRSTQLTILQVLARTGEVSQGRLGQMLAMDSTSLTRTLAIMVQQGWIAERPGKDRRERWLSLSRAGKRQLERALPVWEKTQGHLRSKLGNRSWQALFHSIEEITNLAVSEGGSKWKSTEN